MVKIVNAYEYVWLREIVYWCINVYEYSYIDTFFKEKHHKSRDK